MYHNDDVVEEMATGRQGKIDSIGASTTAGLTTQTSWRVRFEDQKAPPLKYFTNADEIRLVSCPHGETEPGLYPAESLIR